MRCDEMHSLKVRDGVIRLLEAWMAVTSADRVLPVLADFSDSHKANGAEGKVNRRLPALAWKPPLAKRRFYERRSASKVYCCKRAARVACLLGAGCTAAVGVKSSKQRKVPRMSGSGSALSDCGHD
jgi:hypothetical protein